MPDPRKLRVGDRIRFTALPEAWADADYQVHDESVELIRALIERRRSSRVCKITEDGYPWIEARLRQEDGSVEHHSWGIYESTGWVRVVPRP